MALFKNLTFFLLVVHQDDSSFSTALYRLCSELQKAALSQNGSVSRKRFDEY